MTPDGSADTAHHPCKFAAKFYTEKLCVCLFTWGKNGQFPYLTTLPALFSHIHRWWSLSTTCLFLWWSLPNIFSDCTFSHLPLRIFTHLLPFGTLLQVTSTLSVLLFLSFSSTLWRWSNSQTHAKVSWSCEIESHVTHLVIYSSCTEMHFV